MSTSSNASHRVGFWESNAQLTKLLSQGLQSVQSVLGQSGGPALGIPPRRLSSTSDSLFASLTVQALQWAPLYKLPPTWSVFNNSSRPNISFLKIHFLEWFTFVSPNSERSLRKRCSLYFSRKELSGKWKVTNLRMESGDSVKMLKEPKLFKN